MQKELNLLGLICNTSVNLPAKSIACCDTEQAAMRLCVRHHKAGWDQDKIASAIGITPDVLSKMLKTDDYSKRGKPNACRYMSRTLSMALQQECGNKAIDQWADMCSKGLLNCQRSLDEEEAVLEARLADVRARKAVSR